MISGKYLLLGSNLGDRISNLDRAKVLITSHVGVILESSSIYETAAWGITDQPSFYNQVIQIATELKPMPLLDQLLWIENALGRVREEKWGARTIDLDILYYDDECFVTENLQIPHPGIPDRRFTLVPLAEIAADFIHPVLRLSNKQLLEQVEDILEVKCIAC